jgi:hypothetical protein
VGGESCRRGVFLSLFESGSGGVRALVLLLAATAMGDEVTVMGLADHAKLSFAS